MSVFIFLILAAVSAEIEGAVQRCQERRKWAQIAPRRARRYTFN